MTHPWRLRGRNAPLPVLDSIGPSADLGSEIVRGVWYRRTDHPSNGLLGWVRCQLRSGIVLDWIEVRRTVSGRLKLKFPGRKSGSIGYRYYSQPVDDKTSDQFEREVFLHLAVDREGGP